MTYYSTRGKVMITWFSEKTGKALKPRMLPVKYIGIGADSLESFFVFIVKQRAERDANEKAVYNFELSVNTQEVKGRLDSIQLFEIRATKDGYDLSLEYGPKKTFLSLKSYW